ncbi:MAG: hypothetical protein M1338_02775 [Patescibacteria group bacterium]|nr:hypothetical protein [Patescibacteria group bacterium]
MSINAQEVMGIIESNTEAINKFFNELPDDLDSAKMLYKTLCAARERSTDARSIQIPQVVWEAIKERFRKFNGLIVSVVLGSEWDKLDQVAAGDKKRSQIDFLLSLINAENPPFEMAERLIKWLIPHNSTAGYTTNIKQIFLGYGTAIAPLIIDVTNGRENKLFGDAVKILADLVSRWDSPERISWFEKLNSYTFHSIIEQWKQVDEEKVSQDLLKSFFAIPCETSLCDILEHVPSSKFRNNFLLKDIIRLFPFPDQKPILYIDKFITKFNRMFVSNVIEMINDIDHQIYLEKNHDELLLKKYLWFKDLLRYIEQKYPKCCKS